MPKWTDTRTGRVYEGDEYGNEIGGSPDIPTPKKDYILQTDKDKEPTIKGLTRADILRNELFNTGGRYVVPFLNAIGGLAGGLAGGTVGQPILGGAAGTAISSGLGNILQAGAPQIFGEGGGSFGGDVLETAKDVAIGTAFDVATKGAGLAFPSARRELLEKLVEKFRPGAAIKAGTLAKPKGMFPQVDLTVGQTNRGAELMENWLAPGAKLRKIAEQRNQLGTFFEPKQFVNPEPFAETAQAKALAQRAIMQTTRQSLYDDFKPFVGKNTKEVEVILPVKNKMGLGWSTAQPVTRKVKIEGAIPLIQSKKFAEDLGAQIDNELGPDDINLEGLGAGVGNNLKRIRTELNKIRNVRTAIDAKSGIHTDDPLMAFNQLKSLKDQLNQFLRSGADPVLKDRLRGSLKALATTINQDIEEGVKGWGKTAYNKYRKAQDYHAKMAIRYKPKIARDLLKAGEDPETTYTQVIQDAMSDPQKLRHFIKTVGDKTDAKQMFMDRLSKAAHDPQRGFYEPSQALKFFESNEAMAQQLYSPTERANLKHFLTRASLVKDIPSSSGAALKLSQGRAAISIGTGLVGGIGTGVMTGNPAYAGAVFSIPMLGGKFAEKVLMNPKYQPIAAGLLKASPRSMTAKRGTAAMLLAMKGMQGILTTPDGREIPAYIDAKGNPVPLPETEDAPEE